MYVPKLTYVTIRIDKSYWINLEALFIRKICGPNHCKAVLLITLRNCVKQLLDVKSVRIEN
jgi:hypothetical protein